jgi:uracil-DNA glycosylase
MTRDELVTAVSLIPPQCTLTGLREAATACRACPIAHTGQQTVFGEGPPDARLLLVGEQAGDYEDREGRPFVGPAGEVLDEALEAVGIHRPDTYITNVVKHFKWVAKGKRRLHQKPNAREIGACLPWLDTEIDLIKPTVLLALGSTAAQALLGKEVRVTRDRGILLPTTRPATHAAVTIHPSAILRMPTDADRSVAMRALIDDLRRVAAVLDKGKTAK